MFKELENETFDAREQRIQKFWEEHQVFETSVKNREKNPTFTFYDGPPFATGLPHYGHLLAGTIKDVVPRYMTMKGHHVPRRFGWDCHGLPIENEIEKAQNLTGAASIESFGVANFNEECRKIVLRYTSEWKKVVNRMGRWVDFNQVYRTMDLPFMESVWWVFKQLHEKGLIYEGFKVMPYSAKLGTPLSNFEAGENYKDVDDPSLVVAFPLVEDPSTSLLIWTTTPWTLISNLAVMAGPEMDYVKIKENSTGKQYILAKPCLPTVFKNEADYTILENFKGRELEGKRYLPPFDYFTAQKEKGAFRIIMEPGVAVDEGTGLVHSAPAFGEMDFFAAQREKIELVCPVDNNGKFTQEIPEYTGQFVKDADKDIARRIKQSGRLFSQATLRHRYPFCWRSDTPLIYKALRTWFVAVEKIKDGLIASNDQIHWTPSHIKHGRFGKWLEGARDWAISRNRYWGTPLPIWRASDGDMIVIGSIAELEQLTGEKIVDLHRHYIDHLEIQRNGKIYRRIPEVFDCWFESGSMPYAQNHYPFENQKFFEGNFPADFIAEGLDQTRGWFYTLTILSTALFQKPAFKNVIVNGIVLAEDGAKMSKRLRNYPDPMEVVHKFGADAVRLYMMHSPAVKGDDLRFSESGVELIVRQILIPWWNAYSFFITYARIYNWKPTEEVLNWKVQPEASVDRWMLSNLNKLIHEVEAGMDGYDLSQAVEPFVGMIDQLTNWYIRRSRRRFWEEKHSKDRDDAFATLYLVLLNLSKIAAPFVPFISDAIYQNLRTETMPISVHLCDYPQYHQERRDIDLEISMAAVQTAVSLGHALRKENKLKVRQPLAVAHIASHDPKIFQFLEGQSHLIAEELNVKQIKFGTNEEQFVSIKIKPNFRVLGKKVGKLMPRVQEQLNELNQAQIQHVMEGRAVTIKIDDVDIELLPEELQVERNVHEGIIASHANHITVALEIVLTDELLLEGLAREIVNKLNNMRRDANLAVTDRIHVTISPTDRIHQCFDQYRSYITGETLATVVTFGPSHGTEWDLNGEIAVISIAKAS